MVLDSPDADIASAVAAMKAGAIDYVTVADKESLRTTFVNGMTECHGAGRATTRDENAIARLARLTPRAREVLVGLVIGGSNKTIGQELGISPRTVELHSTQAA